MPVLNANPIRRANAHADPLPALRLLIGPPRSGTTLLAYLLSGGTGALAFSEPLLARAVLPDWKLQRLFRLFQSRTGLNRRRPPHNPTPDNLLRYLRRLARANRRDYPLIKETFRAAPLPGAWRNIPNLDHVRERCRAAVSIVRHPFDATASFVKLASLLLGWRGRLLRVRWPILPAFRDRAELVSLAARNWAAFAEWTRAGGIARVRYEDLVARPETVVPLVCGELRIPFSSAMLRQDGRTRPFGGIGDFSVIRKGAGPLSSAPIGRGRQLSDTERALIRRICGPHAESFGYPLAEPIRCLSGSVSAVTKRSTSACMISAGTLDS